MNKQENTGTGICHSGNPCADENDDRREGDRCAHCGNEIT